MNTDRKLMTEKILSLTLDILYLLTGKDYIIVKKPGNDVTNCNGPFVSGGSYRTQSASMVPPSHLLIHERNNDQKILELTNQIIHLLTGEVPIRCEDVTVHLSMKEWEYLEDHQDFHQAMTMKNRQPTLSLDESISRRTFPVSPDALNEDKHSTKNYPGCLTITDRCTTKKCTPSVYTDHNKEDSASCQEEILPNAYTARECKQTEYSSTHIKEELTSRKDRKLTDNFQASKYSSANSKEESVLIVENNLTDIDRHVPKLTEYTSDLFNESALCEEKNLLYTPTERMNTEHLSVCIKEESTPLKDRPFTDPDIHLLMKPTQTDYPSTHIKEESDSWEEVIVTDNDLYEPTDHADTEDAMYNKEGVENNDNTSTPVMSFRVMKFSECGEIVNNQFHTHTVEGMYNCSECQKCFPNNFDLFKHQTAHKEKMLACPECGKNFSCKARLIRHYRSHTGTKLFSCSACGKWLTDKSSLITHQRSHMGDKPFSCSVCAKSFTTQSDLVRHKRTHTGEKPFSCTECGKRFTQSSHLLRHHRLHTEEKIFTCFECGTSFPSKISLAAHHKIHTREHQFPCSVCGKCFNTQTELSRHQRIHTGEKPFACFVCGRCFTQSAHLSKHLKSHTGEKPFSCSVCGKRYCAQADLVKHQRIHT
ncbi:oocyte zinc finger -like [Pelobates cultripes]|uniref:Oocyte zinc finger -like n=1 Tax=Pelobates cultripes TaxID=61616 RepID=A0AAD1TC04_PELCU|nr:oocyte zinc finger -like [Pelobates cultripes]